MADHFTNRLALPYPDIDDPADVPADMQQLAERLDLLIPAGSGGGLVLNRVTVGDVGMAGQVRAGRALTLADFTALGLSAPRGLWNLSDLTDASGNGRALTNKGAVTFAPGINGLAATAAQFTGSTAQALYIADTGAADPLRITTGSWGCWFRTAKRATAQLPLGKVPTVAGNYSYHVSVTAGNVASALVSLTGTSGAGQYAEAIGVSDVADDRWHFVIGTHDGTTVRVYVDAVLEATASLSGTIFSGAAPLNVGAWGADAATVGVNPHYGRVDEAFVTADVLSDDQVRNLYCAKLAHGYVTMPSGVKLNVTRRKRGAAWAVADFPAQPLRLYNFTGGVLTDAGSNNVPLTVASGVPSSVAGPDGTSGNAYSFNGSSSFGATDAGLPSALSARSWGCWLKTIDAGNKGILGWGTLGSAEARLLLSSGAIASYDGANSANGPYVADGQWHHVVTVEDNTAADGVKRKLYFDGRCIAGNTALASLILAGANKYRIGSYNDGTLPFIGQVDGVFVTDVALTFAQIAALWAKGSQALSPSPKNPGDHVEAWDVAAVYATFDTLDSNAQVDLGVAA